MRSDRLLGYLGSGRAQREQGHRRDTASPTEQALDRAYRFLLNSLYCLPLPRKSFYSSRYGASPLGKGSLPGKRKAAPEKDRERLSKLHALREQVPI